MEKDLYNMDLHDTLTPTIHGIDVQIIRVIGGWIYITYNPSDQNGNYEQRPVFIPFNNEFQKV